MKKKSLGRVTRTARGFEMVEFKDRSGNKCTLQVSSIADYEQPGTSAIWLGPDDAEPKILASQAHQFDIVTTETCGWIPYPVPEGVSLNTCAHLSRDQVSALIVHLQNWLDKDTLKVGRGQ